MYTDLALIYLILLLSRRLGLALAVLFAKESVLASDPIRIEDLEEIPKESWPDLTEEILFSAPVSNENNEEHRSWFKTNSSDQNRQHEEWSPFVVNGDTYAEHLAKKNRTTDRKLATVATCDSSAVVDPKAKPIEICTTIMSNECTRCIKKGDRFCPTANYNSGYCCKGASY